MDFELKSLLLERINWDDVLEIMRIETKTRSGFYTIELPCNLWGRAVVPGELDTWYLHISIRLFPSKKCYSDDWFFQGDITDFVASICTAEEQEELVTLAQSRSYHCRSKKQKSLPFD